MIEDLIKKHSTNNKRKKFWENSKFEPLVHQTSDARGVWGEEFVEQILKISNIDCVWFKDKNIKQENGVWDILVIINQLNNIRLEVKTAFKGTKSDTWQHDNIYKENYWDKIIFVDVDYDKIYITVQNRDDIPFDDDGHKILKGKGKNGGKKSTRHLSAWKFDLTKNQLQVLERHGLSFLLDVNNPDYLSLSVFLNSFINPSLM